MTAGPEIGRRGLMRLAATAAALAPTIRAEAISHPRPDDSDEPPLLMASLRINGETHRLAIEGRATLLDTLRERLGLTGTKKGCDQGQCGACTVLVDGRRVLACLTLAASIDTHQREVTTIEGLGSTEALHPMQAAFVRHDGLQCGYCTPGQIMSAVALLAEAQRGAPSAATAQLTAAGPVPLSQDEVRERMSGNICRCGAYRNIVAAIQDAGRG